MSRDELPVEIRENSWLLDTVKDKDETLDAMKGYRLIPRCAIIQDSSRQDMKSLGSIGSVVNTVNKTIVSGPGITFCVVPVFFYTSWLSYPDVNDSIGFVEETRDPNHPFAVKAASENTREEPYPNNPKMKRTYAETLNVACIIYGEHMFTGSPILLQFNKGEYQTGKTLLNRIMTRMIPGSLGEVAKSYSQVHTLLTGTHKNKSGKDWYGFNFPNEGPLFVNGKQEYSAYKKIHEDIVASFKANVLHTNLGMEREETPSTTETSGM